MQTKRNSKLFLLGIFSIVAAVTLTQSVFAQQLFPPGWSPFDNTSVTIGPPPFSAFPPGNPNFPTFPPQSTLRPWPTNRPVQTPRPARTPRPFPTFPPFESFDQSQFRQSSTI